MGFFDLFKRFSSKPEEVVVQKIKLEQLEGWIDGWSKKRIEKANTELLDLRQRLADEKEKITENLQKLKQAELSNKNIPERAKHLMEGARSAYIQKVTTFFGELDLPEQLDSILEFCDGFDKNLEQLGKNTMRNYQILQEFFGVQVSAVSATIKHMHTVMEEITKITQDAGIQHVKEIKSKVKQMQQKIERKQEIKEQLDLAKQELQKESKEIEDKEKKIKDLEEGSAYKKFNNLIDEKRLVLKEIQDLETPSSFSVIQSALKKYERLSLDDTLVRKYLDNPVKALVQDKEMLIVSLLAKMKSSILSGELELKDKKKDKILLELNKLDRDYFEVYVTRYNESNKKLKVIESEVETLTVVHEIEDMKKSLIQTKGRAEKNQTRINALMKELEDINIDHLKKNMEKEIKDTIGEAVIVN